MTQYVYVNDTVTFECATNVTGSGNNMIYFVVGGSIEPSKSSATLPNGGVMISISLTATNELNETDVVCRTLSGSATETAYLYIQG